MRINFLLLILLAIVNVSLGEDAYTKLSVCGSARAVPTDTQNENPTCSTPVPDGMPTASLSAAAFGTTGARCGQCFQLTGPVGKVTVMITDRCDGGSACKQTDLFNFIISTKDYKSISNSTTGNIFSLGSQIVSCGFIDSIKATFFPPDKGSVNYSTYLGVVLSNNNVAVKSMSIKGNGMVNYQAMTGQNGKFSWNKKDTPLSFPATLLITSNTGDRISYPLNTPPVSGQPVDIGKQFNPATDSSLEANDCTLATLPEYVYKDSDEYGWASYFSFTYDKFTAASTNTQSGSGKCIDAILNPHGGVQFFRDGQFSTKYLDKLSFDMKTEGPSTSLSVYFGAVSGSTAISPALLTPTWSTVVLNLKDLNASEIVDRLTFFNLDSTQKMSISLDNIKWIFTEDAPEQPTMGIIEVKNKQPTTSGGATTGVTPSSSGTIGGDSSIPGIDESNSNDEEENSNGRNASSNSIILLPSIVFIIFNIISLLF